MRAPAALLVLAAVACAPAPRSAPGDAGADGAAGLPREAGTDAVAALRCGEQVCREPTLAAVAARACCLADGRCGVTAPPSVPGCVAPDATGRPDPACPDLTLPGGDPLPGCCSASGRCGALDRGGLLGCFVPASSLDAGACAPPDASCPALVELPCDGPEDCADGEQCCARPSGGRFEGVRCASSCEAIAREAATAVIALCHSDADCGARGERCAGSGSLPAGVGRCGARDDSRPVAPAVEGPRCGDALQCGRDERCCWTGPGAACAAEGSSCGCPGG